MSWAGPIQSVLAEHQAFPSCSAPMPGLRLRELLETAIFVAVWALLHALHRAGVVSPGVLTWVAAAWALVKFSYFLIENGTHIIRATSANVPYYRFLLFMAYNIGQMALSFALDFHVLYTLTPGSMNGVPKEMAGAELLFEFFFYSVLNFSFFGFGEVTPATPPLKFVTLLEVVLALLMVIFILGDFISIKESMGGGSQTREKG